LPFKLRKFFAPDIRNLRQKKTEVHLAFDIRSFFLVSGLKRVLRTLEKRLPLPLGCLFLDRLGVDSTKSLVWD